MNKRIKIYAVILSIVYAGMFVTYLVKFIDTTITGVKNSLKEDVGNKDNKIFTFHVNVEPKRGLYSFPTKASEIAQAPLSMLEMDRVKIKYLVSMPSNYFIYFGVNAVVSLVIMACLLYVPFLFFKIVGAVTKGEIFGVSVVKRIKKIGWIIVAYFVYTVFYEVFEAYFARQLVQIDDYEVVFSTPDLSILILGLITLFLGEVLRTSILMKEEQDLTI